MAENVKVPKMVEKLETQLDQRQGRGEETKDKDQEEGKKTGENAGPPKPKQQVVCRHWILGRCKKADNCTFLHENDKGKFPDCFYPYALCPERERCPFKHYDGYQRKDRNCPFYDKGFCKNGIPSITPRTQLQASS